MVGKAFLSFFFGVLKGELDCLVSLLSGDAVRGTASGPIESRYISEFRSDLNIITN